MFYTSGSLNNTINNRIVDKLRYIYAKNIRYIFNYFYYPRGNSLYDAVFSLGSYDYLLIIARTTITT
ncbi:hypothetical protein GGP41_004395 [Bipolaris sorokiniana]|uniref:Uncharacterized protein n=1 Tax=Cochliobolus sativus TaxID=45130 RepID=A0A8H6DXL5_COCSA|nr:hypothetical protein GGP41_004395 [Bipolaris sorokiniana]